MLDLNDAKDFIINGAGEGAEKAVNFGLHLKDVTIGLVTGILLKAGIDVTADKVNSKRKQKIKSKSKKAEKIVELLEKVNKNKKRQKLKNK